MSLRANGAALYDSGDPLRQQPLTTTTSPARRRHHDVSALRVAALAQNFTDEPVVSRNLYILEKRK